MRVACIGASVAGLGTALELLKLDRSIDVTLFDKKTYLDAGERINSDILCGGAISSFMLRELNIKLPSHVIASKIDGVRIYAPNGSFWNLNSHGEPYGYVLWREKFQLDMAEKILDLGGKIYLKRKIKGLEEVSGYDYVVGADGLTGVSARLLGFPPLEDVHIAVQRTGYIPNHPRNRIDLYFGNETASKGYGWVFPAGEKLARVGLGVPLSLKTNPNKLLDSFMEKVEAYPVPKDGGKLIPTAKPPGKLVYGNVVLVGDAARLCDPLTGGGIAPALLSGKHAARAISKGRLDKYDSYCGGLKRRNFYRYRLKRTLYELTDEEFNEMIDVMREFQPKLTRISWAIAHAIITLGRKKPKLFTKHKVLRRLIRPN